MLIGIFVSNRHTTNSLADKRLNTEFAQMHAEMKRMP